MIGAIMHEIAGLFVDDGLLALGLVLWTVIIGLLHLALPGAGLPLALGYALGCVALLLASVLRASGARRGDRLS